MFDPHEMQPRTGTDGTSCLENVMSSQPMEPWDDGTLPRDRNGSDFLELPRPESKSSVTRQVSASTLLRQISPGGVDSARASQSYMNLLQQLLQQHLQELSERSGTSGAFVGITTPPVSSTSSPQFGAMSATELKTGAVPAVTATTSLKETSSQRGNSKETSDCSDLSSYTSEKGTHYPRSKKRKSIISQLLEDTKRMENPNEIFNDSLDKESGTQTPDLRALAYPLDVETDAQFAKRYAKLSLFEKVQEALQSNRYEVAVAVLLCVNVLWMAVELQFSGHQMAFNLELRDTQLPLAEREFWASVFGAGENMFTALFTIDVVVRIFILRCKFFRVYMNYIDIAVTVASLTELVIFHAVDLPVNPILFRLLRIGKLARAIRMVTMNSVLASLQLLIKCIAASMNMLFWSFCLLTFVQCVAGMVASTLCRDFIENEKVDVELRREVFRYYGTFTRTFLTMFETLFANWGPPCRVVVENISEWFSLFFLSYRCVLGFAVLNVVNAVFVQQTMKTASSDEELAFKQKERDVALYTRKVKKLFMTMDSSGDGTINKEEFAKLVNSPMLKFWMGQLELEYHDLMSLFEFLDNGDGEITLMEFIEGAARLKGGAKALDIWRIETKLEVLLGDVLSTLKGEEHVNSVKNALEKSEFRHIRANVDKRNHQPDEQSEATAELSSPISDKIQAV